MTPAEFLEARYASEEMDATALGARRWTVETSGDFDYTISAGRELAADGHTVIDAVADVWRLDVAGHIGTWDPDRVLAEVQAKRSLLRLATASCPDGCLDHSAAEHAGDEAMSRVMLRTLLRPYRQHPEFDREWE